MFNIKYFKLRLIGVNYIITYNCLDDLDNTWAHVTYISDASNYQ